MSFKRIIVITLSIINILISIFFVSILVIIFSEIITGDTKGISTDNVAVDVIATILILIILPINLDVLIKYFKRKETKALLTLVSFSIYIIFFGYMFYGYPKTHDINENLNINNTNISVSDKVYQNNRYSYSFSYPGTLAINPKAEDIENTYTVSFFDDQGKLKLDAIVEETSEKADQWLLKNNYQLSGTYQADSGIWQLASWLSEDKGKGAAGAIVKGKYAYRLAWHEENLESLKNIISSFTFSD
jgi:hypothetical protein